jgi:group II intron reverse transcriptase/maturase
VLAIGNLQAAWRYIKKRAPAFGVDGQSVEDFHKRAGIELRKLSRELHSGDYVPQPLLGYSIPKDGNSRERREISIVAIRDRIAQQAFRQIIEPIWDRRFTDSSYGWRRGRSVRSAIDAARDAVRGNNHWAVVADIENCFGSMKPALVLQQAAAWTNNDFTIVSWIDVWMRSGRVLKGKDWQAHHEGIPQGMGIAPLLANRYLHELDVHAARKGWVYLRYGDDIRIFSRSKELAAERYDELSEFVESKLQLTLKNRNMPLARVGQGIPFLGIKLHGVSARLSEEKRQSTIDKFRSKLPRTLDEQPEALDSLIQRWRNHYWPLLETEEIKRIDRIWGDWVAVRVREWRRGGATTRQLRKWLELRQWALPLSPEGREKRAGDIATGRWNIESDKVREFAASREIDLGKQGVSPRKSKPLSAKRRLAQQRRRFEKRQLNRLASDSIFDGTDGQLVALAFQRANIYCFYLIPAVSPSRQWMPSADQASDWIVSTGVAV